METKPTVMNNMPDDTAQTRFQMLIEKHRGIVLKVAYSYCRHAADRDDLAQEICAQLWKSFARYDESRKFSTWMYRVALNVAISHVRRNEGRPRSVQSITGDDTQIAAPEAPDPDERITALNLFIARLDPLNRALVLLYLEEHSYREIAEVLGITETNVATKINRLKQRICEELTL